MIFTEITYEELEKHQKEDNSRYFFPQGSTYKKLANKNNIKSKILAVKENNKIIAYSTFIYYRYKKFFYKATTQFGPIMDYNNDKLVDFYFKKLKEYFKKDFRVISVRVNPFLNEKLFSDIEETGENSIATSVRKHLENNSFKPMNEDLFTNPTLATRCVFSKELTNITKENILKNISQIARYTINRTAKEGVLVREIDIFNEADAKIFDDINKDTEKRINFEVRDIDYFKTLKSVYKYDLILAISYIDCDKFVNNTIATISNLENEKNNLLEKLKEGKVNTKKTNNKIKELDENISIWKNKIAKIKKLKRDEGNIINLSCASFIKSKQDFIYFSSGAYKKFSRYEGPYAVLFAMMKYAIENKYKYFNFYGTNKDFSEKSSDYGVLQFKRNFNGNVEWFMDNYELRNNLGKYISW
ncbi:peptidoglycan bridge formation glycyltransferase FemA/FemB family protein [Gemelliphila asaccharolytica]|uniref:FemAB family protein n=1 Tax=Gemelliphila asaccharolytica TaxID=502393 RepID=A0ABR5TKG3_9BACL|nr:peptidoglycan bridge formation glycyltransferase FemA/FemB family protein [Gemella asaccharolytica]KXB55623.1 FemAB family protein [Gemella asaccharolytica]